MVLLPVVSRFPVGALSVKKGGELFTADRALGLGWERCYAFLRGNGKLDIGDVQVVDLWRGRLEVKRGRRWSSTAMVDVELTRVQHGDLANCVVVRWALVGAPNLHDSRCCLVLLFSI